ncbi:2-oxo-4-hydroxy-4-carboxy-5-ureidoimidazoline decarboxylase [Dankookia sp. GCM10030260]|uniref:2-oxo-4-hydroxy-4-carboxy-5-ureidoimidazoline decarboxylase n=1 Tax=Dankookia sp. GCM10030260 TaxID=3273390 RepID=UPI003606C9C1
MTRNDFLARFGSVFENRPDLVEAVWALGPDCGSAEALHASFAAVLHGLRDEALTMFLDGHPDLAGKLLETGAVTADSAREQGSAGLDALDAAARARFLAMNADYRARFGIPFIMAVRDRSAAEILAAFTARLGNTPEAERAEAVRQIGRILLLRLHDRFGTTAQE